MTFFNLENFEDKIAKANLKFDDVLYYLDHYAYFKLLRLPILGLQINEIACNSLLESIFNALNP